MKGKHFAKANWSRTRIVSAILSVILLFGCITFSSAWLIAEDKDGVPVVNEFTGSGLNITLTPDGTAGTYQLVPGVTYNLSENETPYVTVVKGSVECYLFVVVHETVFVQGTTKPYFDWASNATEWERQAVVYGLEEVNSCTKSTVIVPKNDELGLGIVAANPTDDKKFKPLTSFKVNDSLTKLQVHPDYFTSGTQPLPQISMNAYAIQTLGFKGCYPTENEALQAAWNVVKEAIQRGNTKQVVLE